ncbi:hypothetical protein ACK3TF_002357 [Chlorella vulgaris]
MRNDEDTTRQWLASHGLSPLIDLRQLRKTLDAPGIGWPCGTATPAQLLSPVSTPAGLGNMLQGTPASQHRTLPTPGFLDFGAPAAPAAKEFYWRNSDTCQPPQLECHSVAPATAAATAAAFEAAAWAAETDNTSASASARQPDVGSSLPTQPVPAQTVYRKLVLPPCLPRLQPADEPSSSAPSAPCQPAQPVTSPTLPTVRACAEEAAAEPPAEERPTASSLSGTHSLAALADRPRRSRRRRVLASEYVWDNEHADDAANAAATLASASANASASEPASSSASASTPSALSAAATNRCKKARVATQLVQEVQQTALLRQIRALNDQRMTAPRAAAAMGCSPTSFRKLCRSVGIARWPPHTND